MIRTSIALAALAATLIASSALAQRYSKPFAPLFTSAPTAAVEFNFEIVDSTFYDAAAIHLVNYRDTSATPWSNAPMTLLYHACSTYTYSGAIVYTPPSGALEWYLRSENDTAVVSQSPKNKLNVFPVPSYLLADMGNDPVGDAVGDAGTWLDITGCGVSYSDTKLYFRLTNNGGGFPTKSGYTTYFIYSVGVIDPDATDSVAYAVVYASIPPLLSPGLYKINPVDTSFARIGDIVTDTSGNALSLSCNISDLTAQPGWSTWPPPSGFIMGAPVTATQIFLEMTTNDIGRAFVYLPESQLLSYSLPNAAPQLSGLQLTTGSPNKVSASVVYSDGDDNLPTLRQFHFGDSDYAMEACEKNYEIGSVFACTTEVDTSGWYQHYCIFSDGKDTVSTPVDYLFVSVLVAGDADGSGAVDISDAVFLIAYIFAGGPAPDPLSLGDANCDGTVDISDAVYLITYIFGGGPAPCI